MNYEEIEYAGGLEEKKISDKSESAKDNILRFYNTNKGICDESYKYYSEFNAKMAEYLKKQIHMEPSEFLNRVDEKKILIMTANQIERSILLRRLCEKKGGKLDSFMVGSYIYNVYNGFKSRKGSVSLIHADPGRTGEDFTRRLLNNTCMVFKPNCIVALGICYGFNKKEKKIGDVLLSDNVTVFRINYRDSRGTNVRIEAETEFEKQPSNRMLQLSLQKSMYIQPKNFLSKEEEPVYARMQTGRFLSINSLMSNTSVKQALVDQYGRIKPKLAAGEMEGPGLLKSDYVQEQGFSNWLIMKSICDWGEMKNDLSDNEEENDRIKDSLQAFAMVNSCSAFETILPGLCEVCYE